MDTAEELQQLEITALRSIYAEDFIDVPPPTVWKSAARLQEFVIRVVHPDAAYAAKINFHLNVKFPKTYPTLACPTFTITKGLSPEHTTKLTHAISAEAQRNRGSEMVFQIVSFAQEWLAENVVPHVEVPGSLAVQMNQRAMGEERARKQRDAEAASLAQAQAAKIAHEREEMFKEDALRQLLVREQQYALLSPRQDHIPAHDPYQRRRARAGSEATEIPGMDWDEEGSGDTDHEYGVSRFPDTVTMTETFPVDVEVGGVCFNTVRLFHPRPEGLGTVYLADPVCDDVNATLPLELYVVTFYSEYYRTSQGRKKLKQVEAEIQRLISIRHPNHTSVFAVKLTGTSPFGFGFGSYPTSGVSGSPTRTIHSPTNGHGGTIGHGLGGRGPPQLMVLSEQAPALTLYDVLQDCESLREDRAKDYLAQILSGLNAIHAGDLVHRGISSRTIGLATVPPSTSRLTQSKLIKLGRVGFPTRLLDLHRSNPFGSNTDDSAGGHLGVFEEGVPEAWLSRDVKNESSLLYTRHRDIHSVGIVLLQMLLGLDVTERYASVQSALQYSSISPALSRHAFNMLLPSKKAHVSCLTLLGDLAEASLQLTAHPRKISVTGVGLGIAVGAGGEGGGDIAPMASAGLPTPMGLGFTVRGRYLGQGQGQLNGNGSSPPDVGYFHSQTQTHQSQPQQSRWKEDWEELELLGKGGFGSVVKARNKIDNRIYAVKKIRLKGNDDKIFREINALSRLSHRFIVRYYTTWIERHKITSSTTVSDDSTSEDGFSDINPDLSTGTERVGNSSELCLPVNGGGLSYDFGFGSTDGVRGGELSSSFPSIHFGRSKDEGRRRKKGKVDAVGGVGVGGGSGSSSSGSGSSGSSGVGSPGSDEDVDVGFGDLFGSGSGGGVTGDMAMQPPPMTPPMQVTSTLYIQMEFVERQTLQERIDEGISEDEAWRLFQQILEALVHMSTLSILHRDIKLTNIFIDAKGDCKVGDFGLATSSLAAVDPSDVSPHVIAPEADMTLEVGTRLYIAPEVQSRKRGPRNHNKADMYSLGIVFFEMNYTFSTRSERIAVIEDIRKPGIYFPHDWDPLRTQQREIITWLLQHQPDDRPTALELSQSPLLPQRLEDEYFKSALKLMTKADSPHHQAVLSSLFSQPPRPGRGFIYDLEADLPEHAALNGIVQERLASIFRLHGAVDMEPPLLMPLMDSEDEKHKATFIDQQGDVVTLPDNILVPFARLAARGNIKRIKRYHVTDVFRPSPVTGHPKVQKAAVFDIITPDLLSGPTAASAEIIALANDCLNSFPNLSPNYDIHISHSRIVDLLIARLPSGQRSAVIDIMGHTKTSQSQKRALLLKRGLLRSTADELELLAETDDDIDAFISRLEKVSPALVALIQPAVEEVKRTVQYANAAGVSRKIFFHPLMLGSHHSHFKDGVLVEVVRRGKRLDVLAVGGRYDNLIAQHAPLKPDFAICAIGIQIAMEKITVALASFQSSSVKALVKEERSFGFWSPRRCDVYVVSYHPGYLQDRLDVVAYLWQHNISADIMYESGLPEVGLSEVDHENHIDLCVREGILFTVYPRPRAGRRDQPAFKVKSILKGTEYELSRQELVPWLQNQIAEQKRIDIATSGAPVVSHSIHSIQHPPASGKDTSDLQLLLPTDAKKQRKQVKQLFLDRAFQTGVQIKSAFQSGLPTLAIDVSPVVFDSMTKNSSWITEDDAWKPILASFSNQQVAYAQQVREAAAKRKAEGCHYLILFAVREERVQLLTLS